MSIPLTDDEKLAVAARFAAASRSNDADAYRALCAPDAVTWHNFDEVEVPVDTTVATIGWLHKTVRDLSWTDVSLVATSDGFVSQTVMSGEAPRGQLKVHSCVVVTLDETGLITRVDEYLDPAQTGVLRG